MRLRALLFTVLAVTGCSSSSKVAPDAPATDAGAAEDAAVDKSAACASTFGQAIGSLGFARFDGTVVAIVPPGDPACAEENSTHLVLQIRIAADVYRMVVDVSDTSAPGTIHAHTLEGHALIGEPWSPGWHKGLSVDYVKDLGLAYSQFDDLSTNEAVAAITSAIDLGANVSVYATAAGESDSAHFVHRTALRSDGAIVLAPDGPSPTWLLFAFQDHPF